MNANRKEAIRLVDKSVSLLTSGAACLADLSDTFNLCAGLDELEEAIECSNDSTPISDLLDLAQDIAAQLLEEEGFPA